jgi:hypothetical protein
MQENLLHIGLCLPKSCNNQQTQILVQKLFDKAEAGTNSDHKMKPRVVEVKDLKFNPQLFLKKSFWIFVAFVFVMKFLNLLARKMEKEIKVDENNNIALGMENEMKLSTWKKIIKCFNFELNKKQIMSKEVSSSAVNSISGLR